VCHLTACPQPGGGHLRHIPRQPPYRDPCATSGSRPFLMSFSGLQEGPRMGSKVGLRMDSQGIEKGAPKGPERVLSKRISKDCFRKSCATLHRFVSRRVASHRVALHRVASHHIFSCRTPDGAHSPPEKLPLHSLRLRKLALQRCELELLRSHPKDERGSVREKGLCVWMCPTLLFRWLSP